MAMTEKAKPYRRGPGGINDAAADVAIVLNLRGPKTKKKKKRARS